MTIIGYARVSTDGQSLQSQTEALHLAGCGRVYSEILKEAAVVVLWHFHRDRRIVRNSRSNIPNETAVA
jgi:DNA invertase Pin-like site-specific DNA recombinase